MEEVIAYHVDKTAALQAGQVIGFEPAQLDPGDMRSDVELGARRLQENLGAFQLSVAASAISSSLTRRRSKRAWFHWRPASPAAL